MANTSHSQPFALLHGEQLEEYRPGGFHPVHIGDTFKDGRYQVLRKLGHGAFSTVGLAEDLSSATFVAIKIGRSDSPYAVEEIRIHKHLVAVDENGDSSGSHIVKLLDNFLHTGPNGQHVCMVFEPMGPGLSSRFKEGRRSMLGIPYEEARSVVKQLLSSLDYLHQHRIAQRDLNFGNILIAIDLSDLAKTFQDNTFSKVERHVYMHEDQPLIEFLDKHTAVTVKLSDLGAAFPFERPPDKPVVPVALRAPEIVLGSEYNHTIDIWSFGCLVFEIFTGSQLFGVYPLPYMTDIEVNDGHLLQMVSTLGQLPPSQFAKWTRGSRYFDSNMNLVRSDAGPDEKPYGDLYVGSTLEVRFMERKPQQMDAEECGLVLSFLRRALQYDPSSRPTTSELLKDPWIKSIVDEL
ncbi:related to serine protein kinase [Ramularia collo-cygni]|uniref:non-specific serine/threonine protein kinase n=1 Tax=Ramularia collo-cygni TaxID=112498 RepID=A0A2D3UTI8_9PEZI|nr:related to serine protein kinase [Ramularia collo-cygni]CZT14086.1 related to serine protein kinase [Ramularia collo-cygni]